MLKGYAMVNPDIIFVKICRIDAYKISIFSRKDYFMKKLIAFFVLSLLLLSFFGCSQSGVEIGLWGNWYGETYYNNSVDLTINTDDTFTIVQSYSGNTKTFTGKIKSADSYKKTAILKIDDYQDDIYVTYILNGNVLVIYTYTYSVAFTKK